MSSAGGGSGGTEVPFSATIDASALLQGLQQITDAFKALNETVVTSASTMNGALKDIGDQIDYLTEVVTTGFNDVDTLIGETNTKLDTLVASTGDVKAGVDGVNSALSSLNTTASDTNSWLYEIALNTIQTDMGVRDLNTTATGMARTLGDVSATALDMSAALQDISADTSVLEDGFLILDEDLTRIDGRLVTVNDNLEIMQRQLGAMSGQLSTVNDNLDIANTRLAAIGTAALRTNTLLDEVNTNLRAMDGSLSDVVLNSDEMVTALNTIIDKLDTLNSSVTSLAPKFDELKNQIKTTGDEARTASEGGLTSMMRSLGHVPATMLAWGIFNTASNWLRGFVNQAIGGNQTLERFHATLTSITGSGSAADKLITWAQQFGQTIPDTTQNLEAATVKIESLGLNAQKVMPPLSDIAAVMHVDLPTAARAFADAYHGRWMMLQNDLNISKEQLQQYGLEVGKKGKVIADSLAPAIAAYAKAKFPDGSLQAMQTYSGQVTNLTDKMQLLAMAFGKPVFKEFESLMFQLIMYLTAHFDGIRNVVTILGDGLAKALGFVVQPLLNLLQILPQHHALWMALAGLLGGTLIGVLVAISVMIVEVIGGVVMAAAPFAALGVVIGIVVQAFRQAYDHSAALRYAIQNLRDALHHLLAAFAPLGGGVMGSVKNALEGAWNAFIKWLQSPMVVAFIWKITDGINWLTQELTKATSHGRGFGGIIHEIGQHFHGLMTILGPLLGLIFPLGGGIGVVIGLLAGGKAQLIKDVWKPIGGILSDLATGGVGLLWKTVLGLLTGFASAPGVIGGLITALRGIVPALPGMLLVIFRALPGIIGLVVTSLVGLGGGALAAVVKLFLSLGGGVSYAITFVRLFLSGIGGLPGILMLVQTAFNGIGPALASLGTWFNVIVSGGLGVFNTIMSFIGTVVIPALTGGLTSLTGAFVGFMAPLMPFIGIALLIAGVLLAIGTAFHDLWTSSAGFRAMIAQVGKEFLSIVGVAQSSLMPVWNQLQSTLKTQLTPAWKALQHAFEEMRPVLVFLGGIIIAIVLVALGLLIGVIKGVISALGPLLSGIIMVFGGIAQVISGVVEVVSAIIGGLVHIIIDLATGHGGKAKADALKMWNDIKDGVGNILHGLWTTIEGIFTSIFMTVIALLGGFVKGVWDWFTHLFDKLVGHSIVTDGMNLILKVISDALTKALLAIANFILGGLQHFAQIAQGIPIIGNFVSGILMHLANLVAQGTQFILNLKNNFVSDLQKLPGEALTVGQNIITSLGNALSGGLSHLRQIAGNIGSNIMSGFKNMLGIASPSRVFSEYGKNIMEGLGVGLGQHDVTSQLATQIAKIRDTASSQITRVPVTVSAAAANMGDVGGSLGTRLGTMSNAPDAGGYLSPAERAGWSGSNSSAPATINITMSIEGDAQFGFRMLDPTTRANLMREMADELGKGVDLQVIQKNGYAGYH